MVKEFGCGGHSLLAVYEIPNYEIGLKDSYIFLEYEEDRWHIFNGYYYNGSLNDFLNHIDEHSDPVAYDRIKTMVGIKFYGIIDKIKSGTEENYKIWSIEEIAKSSKCKCPSKNIFWFGHLDGCPHKPTKRRISYME